MHPWLKPVLALLICGGALLAAWTLPVEAGRLAQQPTISVPTVTGTPGGLPVTVNSDEPQVNVRAGPGTNYDKIGILLAGQTVSSKGRTPGGDWILVDYPGAPGGVGWVYSPNLSIPPGDLPIVEPPPTPKPLVTATIDPTLASQFIVTAVPSRLPTFTPPPPLVVPTLPGGGTASAAGGGIPAGLVITILAGLGVFLGLVSLLRGR